MWVIGHLYNLKIEFEGYLYKSITKRLSEGGKI